MGAACGQPGDTGWQALSDYGAAIGLAFQVVDDILDCTQDSAVLGKTAGKDEDANKPTYVSALGLEAANQYAQRLYTEAMQALDRSGLSVGRLAWLAGRGGPTILKPAPWMVDPVPVPEQPLMSKPSLLENIHSPEDLRKLSRPQLKQLADELRQFLLQSVSRTGGHLSSNLGTVELTIALHAVFNTPQDRLVWDVGHQTYPHKILTGRREAMATLKQLGISGFPRRSESEYDTFGTGHSSTSISAALGMAHAARLKGESRKAVAIIGDGAMTGGMAFEALNNGGFQRGLPDMLVILNDNDMSISPPVGALNRYLARLMSGRFYAAAREGAKSVLKNTPLYGWPSASRSTPRAWWCPATIFEEFGFNYVGPIDGHDLDALIPTLENLRQAKGPQFLHVVTRKGWATSPAEADPIKYHGPGKFDPAIGLVKPPPAAQTFTQVFGQWLCDMAAADERLVGITPAMREGSGMVEFESAFPPATTTWASPSSMR
jgi:1-deoxy-D-xylulose-5-phosphate synthase